MLNQFVLVGRLVEQPTLENEVCYIKLAVSRSFKNENGKYETDIIPIKLIGQVAKSTTEYCNKGDLIGTKGKMQMDVNDEHVLNSHIELIAEKITFLSNKGGNENE